MKKLAVLLASVFVLTACSQATDVSYPVQTEENVQNTQQPADPGQNSTESGTDLPETQDVAENDDVGEPNQVVEDSRERAETTESETVDAPNDEEFALSHETLNPEVCKLRENSYERNRWPDVPAVSFPAKSPVNIDPIGTVKVAVVMVDWEDHQGTDADYSYYEAQAEKFESFYWMASEGRLNIELEISTGWNRISGKSSDYYMGWYEENDWQAAPIRQKFVDAAIDASDASVDYSGAELVLFAIPRTNAQKVFSEGGPKDFGGPNNKVFVRTAEGTVDNYMAAGYYFINGAYGTDAWIYYAHEFGHMVGIGDLNDIDEEDGTYPMYKVDPMGGYDIMDNQWGETRTISSWFRWLQGWLSDSQVVCLDATSLDNSYYQLNQLNSISGGLESVVVKTSDTTALVIESRRWDGRFDNRISNSKDGIVVYQIDSTIGSTSGPARLVSPRDITRYLYEPNTYRDQRSIDAMFFQGDSVAIGGVTIEVVSVGSQGDVVRVSSSR